MTELIASNSLRYRGATASDALVLLAWRNDALTRFNSRNANPVDLSDHLAWLERRLMRESPHLYIAELDGEPVGTVRIDGEEISYTVAPEHRGRGYAKQMLRWAYSEFGRLRAEIRPDNIASIKAAESAGHKVVLLKNRAA